MPPAMSEGAMRKSRFNEEQMVKIVPSIEESIAKAQSLGGPFPVVEHARATALRPSTVRSARRFTRAATTTSAWSRILREADGAPEAVEETAGRGAPEGG
jgi:hypothetical protein